MSSEKSRDPALGHKEDFPEDEFESESSSIESDIDPDSSVIGVPLMDGETRVHEAHPSWWLFLPEIILTGVFLGGIGVLFTWLYTPLISGGFPHEVTTAFETLYAGFAAVITQLGYEVSETFSIPWWVWTLLLIGALYPIMKAYMKARFTHYVITTDRVMSIQTFPGKNKDWAEIQNIRSFTSDADFVEQRLGVGSIQFQPANEDPIVFEHIDEYEYWESKVKEIRQKHSHTTVDRHPD